MGYFTNGNGPAMTSLALSIGEDSELLALVASPDDPDVVAPISSADHPDLVTIEEQRTSPNFPTSVASNRKAGLIITGMKPGRTTITSFVVDFRSSSRIAQLQVNVADLTDANIDLYYFGRYLVWKQSLPPSATGSNYLVFDATSGFLAMANAQNVPNFGPVPEGTYRFKAELDPLQDSVDKANAAMPKQPGPDGPISNTRQGIQYLPNSDPEIYSSWGSMRVRLEPTSSPSSQRGGFYLHNSAKAFTSGCIEVGSSLGLTRQDFFKLLVEYATGRRPKAFLMLKVKYRGPYTFTRGNTMSARTAATPNP